MGVMPVGHNTSNAARATIGPHPSRERTFPLFGTRRLQKERPRSYAAGPVVFCRANRSSPVGGRRLADGDVAAPIEDRLFTSPIALVMRISRGHASMQLKMVRQRHTPSRSFRMSSRSFAFVSRESKMKR